MGGGWYVARWITSNSLPTKPKNDTQSDMHAFLFVRILFKNHEAQILEYLEESKNHFEAKILP